MSSSLPLVQHPAAAPREEARPQFLYDLGDVDSYLAAERVNVVLPVVPEWVPVDGSALAAAAGASGSGAAVGAAGASGAAGAADAGERARWEALARARGLQPLRWPATWPPRSREALIAATYAKQCGRAVAYSLAAFRQAFAGGRDLGERDTVLLAGAACELHPTALLQALARPAVAAALDAATARAAAAGARRVPALLVDGALFHGDAALDAAATALAGAAPDDGGGG